MHVQPVGIFCFGAFIGYLCWYFVVRIGIGQVTADTLASVVGIIGGGVVVKLLDDHTSKSADVWWYPIGLITGFLLYVILFAINKKLGSATPTIKVGSEGNAHVFPTSLGLFKANSAGVTEDPPRSS